MTITFKKAERRAKPLVIGMTGASGSGKTYSALLLAKGLAGPNGRIAVIDTENGASNYYDNLTDFDVAVLHSPSGADYIDAIQMAVSSGEYAVLVIDSLSHDWEKVIEHESTLNAKNMNTWQIAKGETRHTEMLRLIFASPIDVICTIRSDQSYEVGRDEKGNITKKKVGLKPIQQPRFEYDFDLIFDIEMDTHLAIPGGLGKNRTPIWEGDRFVITEKHGQILREWRDSGSEWVEPIRTSTSQNISRFFKALSWNDWRERLNAKGHEKPVSEMSEVEGQEILTWLRDELKNKEKVTK